MGMTKTITRILSGAALAGALLLATPQKAEAQRVGFGISIGTGPVYTGGYYGPRYVRPYPYYPYNSGYYGYYAPRPYYRPYVQSYPRPYVRGGYNGYVREGYRR